ncbi:MAG: DNA-directed RNA polymerase subunit D, partial [Candidatus Aenigmarchaeota archaeon]|nr:DNA-directed RNA polymerase subunit D [Candidatus Aenigmarchaeota archaeon]
KNDSPLNDEIVANRLGHAPLKFDKKAYNMTRDCKCEGKGCSLCQVKLTLKKKGPGMVYVGDLKSRAKDVIPVFDKMPIVELFEDQEMEFEAIATLGLGKEHSKWQGAVVGYTNLFEAKSKAGEMKLCGNHLFYVKDVKGIMVQPVECALCKSLNEDSDAFKTIDDSFLFSIETASGLDTEDIVMESAGILEEKIKEFDKAVKKLK